MIITAKNNTYLKLKPAQSFELSNHEKIPVKTGTQIKCTDLKRQNKGNCLIELDAPEKGFFNWWIYPEHWEGFDKSITVESINWNNPNSKVSRYFTVLEVTQGDPRRIPYNDQIIVNILDLARELDRVRDAWGSPIGITSWYRPEPINSQVGGVPGSTHTLGIAADIFPYTGDEWEFENWLDNFWDRALGYGQKSGRGFTHVDLRPGGFRWDY